MIRLEEILRKEESQTNMPAEMRERILENILKQLVDWLNQKNK